jgi:hypothetical protein
MDMIPELRMPETDNARAISRAGRSGIEAYPRTQYQQLALPRNGGHLVALQAGDGGAMEHGSNYSMMTGAG